MHVSVHVYKQGKMSESYDVYRAVWVGERTVVYGGHWFVPVSVKVVSLQVKEVHFSENISISKFTKHLHETVYGAIKESFKICRLYSSLNNDFLNTKKLIFYILNLRFLSSIISFCCFNNMLKVFI